MRIDKDKSYLLYGDFVTGTPSDARKLANYSRSLTGLKEHYERDGVVVNAFASRDSTRQVIDELRANGTSGPFALSAPALIENSEKVEVLTRDRNQRAVVLKSVALARFVDYAIEPLTGRLLLKAPLPSLDPEFNPNSLRITFEVEQGGARYWVGGVDAQVRIGERVEVGGVWVEDRNPADPSTLRGANVGVKLDPKTVLRAEIAQTDKPLTSGKGNGRRVELKHDGGALQAEAFAGRTDAGFDNPGAALTRGRSEAGARATWKIDERSALKAEVLRTADTAGGARREGVLVSAEHRFDGDVKVEVGVRKAHESAAPNGITGNSSGSGSGAATNAAPADIASVRARITAPLPGIARAHGYAEYEQDVRDPDKRIAAFGADYQFADRGRLYLRHEFISSLSGPYALNGTQKQNATVIGLDTDTMEDGHVFSEYRIRDAYSGGDAQAAIGLRKLWTFAPGVRLGASFERVHTLAGKGSEESTAGSASIELTTDPDWKGSARIELRSATSEASVLATAGFALKLDRDWTALARNALVVSRAKGALSGQRLQERLQLGLAYRDTATNVWNALGRVEHRIDRDDTQGAAALRQRTEIVSFGVNVQPSQPLLLSGRLAAKWSVDDSGGLHTRSAAQLVSLRATRDLNRRWDAGIVASALFGNGGALQQGIGAEIGYLVSRNLWLSAGYNVFGFKDADLAGGDYTNRGAYLRLRYKFDEDVFAGSGARSEK